MAKETIEPSTLFVTHRAHDVDVDAKKPKRAKISLLYVLNAARGSLQPTARKNRYTLRLRGVERHVVWFSDRPARRTGSFSSARLAASWKGLGFAADPPNAALDYTDAKGRSRTVIVELTRPSWRAGRLSFSARVLDPKAVKSRNLAAHTRRAVKAPTLSLRDVSLFVDDGWALVINGCVLQPQTNCAEGTFLGNDLSGLNLTDAFFEEAVFRGSNFSGANLTRTYLLGTDLSGVNFSGANLSGAVLDHSRLVNADFTKANLHGTYLLGAYMPGVDLSTAYVCDTQMPDGAINNADCPQ